MHKEVLRKVYITGRHYCLWDYNSEGIPGGSLSPLALRDGLACHISPVNLSLISTASKIVYSD